MIRAGEESLDTSVSLWYKTQHLAEFTGMPRVRAPRVLLGDVHGGGLQHCCSRKKGNSAERLEEHDLRCAGIRIVEQFLVSFGRAVALWFICQLIPKAFASWSLQQLVLVIPCGHQTALPSQASRAEEPLPPDAARGKRPQEQM